MPSWLGFVPSVGRLELDHRSGNFLVASGFEKGCCRSANKSSALNFQPYNCLDFCTVKSVT